MKHLKSIALLGALALLSCQQHNAGVAEASTVSVQLPKDSVKAMDSVIEKVSIKEELNSSPNPILQFVPENYAILDTIFGDLNLDAYTDLILVLKKIEEEKTSDIVEHPEKRPLLILLGHTDKSYQLVKRNDNTVLCFDCGGVMGDPYQSVTIKKGYFSVEHYGGSAWRWARIITYKYSKSINDWYLFKDGSESFHTQDPDKVESKVLTEKDFGKITFEEFDIYKE